MKRFLKLILLSVVILLVVAIVRTLVLPTKQIAGFPYTAEGVDAQKASRELAHAIPFQTISWEQGGTDEQRKATQEAFAAFHMYLQKAFPRVYAKLDHEIVGLNSLLFTWKGSDASLKPIIL